MLRMGYLTFVSLPKSAAQLTAGNRLLLSCYGEGASWEAPLYVQFL